MRAIENINICDAAKKQENAQVEANSEEIDKLKNEIKELQKKIAVTANSNVAAFKVHFDSCKSAYSALLGVMSSEVEGGGK